MDSKKVILSGVKPTGSVTLGNYIGALRNWAALQDDYNCLYCVADLHAITVKQDPATLRRKTLEVLAQYIASGISPEKNILFIQSHVPAHAELSWALGCFTMFGELSRMTQFKDKSQKAPDNINAGLFTYPVLMAADILVYQADLVPVGADQKQHVELARDVAGRFNGQYGPTFTIPEPYIPPVGARIMSLTDPTKKMSKSEEENPGGYILLLDTPDDIRRKFRRAVTDLDTRVCRSPEKPGISNLMTIYSAATGLTDAQIEAEFEGRGYGDFKAAVGDAVADMLAPVRETALRLLDDRAYLEQLCAEGAARAARIADRTVDKVYRKLGFVKKPGRK